MKPLSEADREKAGNQKIPKLTELLELAQKEKNLWYLILMPLHQDIFTEAGMSAM